MASYRAQPSRADRATAIVAVVGVHVALGALILSGNPELPDIADDVRTVLIDVEPPAPPPPPAPDPGRAREEEGAAGKKAEPTPVVAPKPRIVVPARPPVPAAPVAGTGSSPSAGAATVGSGPGAGGSGSGRGGGGSGGGLASGPRLVSGGPVRADYRRLGARAAGPTRAILRLSVGASGRVESCAVVASTGYPDVDRRICPFFQARMRWNPARDRDGRPQPSWFDFVVTLTPN